MNNKFSGKQQQHANPKYPAEYIDYLLAISRLEPDSVVADIGSGAGFLTALLIERDINVAAIEPDETMRKQAELALLDNPRFASVESSAEHIRLPESSVDCVVAAHAFHYFDAAAFQKECTRILKPGGNVCLVWNTRDTAQVLHVKLAEICKKFCPEFTGFRTIDEPLKETFRHFFREQRYEYRAFPNLVPLPKEEFIGQCLAASYAPKKEDGFYDAFVHAITELFEEYSKDELLTVPYLTRSYIGKV